jgi:hypothetical protein
MTFAEPVVGPKLHDKYSWLSIVLIPSGPFFVNIDLNDLIYRYLAAIKHGNENGDAFSSFISIKNCPNRDTELELFIDDIHSPFPAATPGRKPLKNTGFQWRTRRLKRTYPPLSSNMSDNLSAYSPGVTWQAGKSAVKNRKKHGDFLGKTNGNPGSMEVYSSENIYK